MQASCATGPAFPARSTASTCSLIKTEPPMRSSLRASFLQPLWPAKKAAAHISGATTPMPVSRNAPSSRAATRSLPPLPDVVLEPIVRLALQEDLGVAGDVTTDALIDPEARGQWSVRAREPGVVAGLDAATLSGWMIDPDIQFAVSAPDGAKVKSGDTIMQIE